MLYKFLRSYNHIILRVMLTSALRYWLRIQLKKIFIGEEKYTINVLSVFFIYHKSDVKTFFNWILNQCSKDTY